MMLQRMIISKQRRNRVKSTKTGCPSLRHRKKVYRTSYTLVDRCLTRTSQVSFESHLFTSYVNEDNLIPKPFLNFPMPLPLLSRLEIEERQSCFASQGVLRVILGGGVPPSSPNSDPISDQKVSFSTPFFRPDL